MNGATVEPSAWRVMISGLALLDPSQLLSPKTHCWASQQWHPEGDLVRDLVASRVFDTARKAAGLHLRSRQ